MLYEIRNRAKGIFKTYFNNLAIHNNPDEIKESQIVKIGRKYFYCSMGYGATEKFEIETLKDINEDCNSAWILYFSIQDFLDEQEKHKLLNKFGKIFYWNGSSTKLSLNKLRMINAIIESKGDE